jgi:hypothetical protein
VGVEFLQYLSIRTGELVSTRFADSAQLGIVKNHEFSLSFRHTDSFPQAKPDYYTCGFQTAPLPNKEPT